MDKVDELFGGAGTAPHPRSGLVLGLVATGLVLATGGLACSSAPGGILVLAAWIVVEKERGRVESGYLPADTESEVRNLRTIALTAMMMVLLLFFVQAVLLMLGTYDALIEAVLRTLLEMFPR